MRRLNKWYPEEKNLKNRSTKQHSFIGGRRNILRCVSGAQLKEWERQEVTGANEEIRRRMGLNKKNGSTEEK